MGKNAWLPFIRRHECVTGKYTTRKNHTKVHPRPSRRIFHFLISKDVHEIISSFLQAFVQTAWSVCIYDKLHGNWIILPYLAERVLSYSFKWSVVVAGFCAWVLLFSVVAKPRGDLRGVGLNFTRGFAAREYLRGSQGKKTQTKSAWRCEVKTKFFSIAGLVRKILFL